MIYIYSICILSLLHSYIFYPIILRLLARTRQNNRLHFSKTEALPHVSILLAAYNEALVIEEKLNSILQTNYPLDRLHIFIGSDNSSDETNDIVQRFANEHPRLHFTPFQTRQGKPSVINQLAEQAIFNFKQEKKTDSTEHIFIITDANIMFSEQLIFELVKHFKNEKIALVDSNILNIGMQDKGISKTENSYILGEVRMKHQEGVIWQQTLGPLGGCFALKASYFSPVPSKYLVDDFYLAMRVFEQGGQAINEPQAICYEDVSHSIKEEFRRKTRIASGNFQNLTRFAQLWLPFPPTSLSFIFISHKILRWLGAFFILGSWLSAGVLAGRDNLFFQILFVSETVFLLIIPLLFFTLRQLGIHHVVLRTITYFNAANLAMLRGFFNYLKGIENNVWQPTQRHKSTRP